MSLPMSRHRTIDVLQAGRALAALAVVMIHVTFPTNHLVAPIPVALNTLMERGYLGVDFFFVLSGFILYYVNYDSSQRRGWTARYVESRLTRIYVPYLPVAIALLSVYLLFPRLAESGRTWSVLATLTLIPLGSQSALGTAWTLAFELHFYLWALLFFKLRRPLLCGALWALAIVARLLTAPPFQLPVDTSLASILLNPLNLEFVFGMTAAWLVLGTRLRTAWPFVLGAVASLGLFAWLGYPRGSSYLFGLGLACLLVPLVRLEDAGAFGVPRALVRLGNASYAIYLLHMPLMSAVARISARVPLLHHWAANVLLSLVAAIAAGVAYHRLFENPALAWVRRRLKRWWPRAPAPQANPGGGVGSR
ncbi:Peptidoglycan/LPS O-acetylase OafA/YrhL, contains acyltransferase and SGNH-hydrolase domains [Pseudoxanthomonas sp. GM95]|uniref:acyltransferase family protein n=1 Tax=Pseudoxanthomonas sp. GM95 TaxID=1881043 RepID=UPI0008B90427|nr:acyltransferase [Pseudoxanthomonas sp. GM95]SEM17939.1 Peptidoglycan/LPS O-acetylase OafA/YrhL, contains acyltransferase and SGNH-hydrolase domains [Pseudoxanthomonas sp. GM95]